MRHIRHLQGVLLLSGLLVTGVLRAQDVVVDQYGTEYAAGLMPASFTKPQVSQAQPANQPVLARSKGGTYLGPQKAEPSGDVLVGNLTGVVLVPTPGDVVVSGVPGVRGIWHDLDSFPEKAGNAINAHLGKPVSLSSLDEMVKDVIRAYRQSDRPVVDVLVPEQDITSGVVQLVVVEGRLDNIRVVGATTPEQADYLKRQIRTDRGDVIRASEVNSDLAFMNGSLSRSPYRRVDLVYAPGYRFATTDIVLRTGEFDPFTAYATYENSGNRVLGRDRLIFGAAWNEAFGKPGHTFSYQLSTDIDFDHIISHSLVYSLPFRWRHYFSIAAAHVYSQARIDLRTGDAVQNPNAFTIDISGANWQLSPRYIIPLRKAPDNVLHEIQIGYDFKSLSNSLEYGGFELVNAPTAEIHQFSVGYSRQKQWDAGATRVDLTGYISPGGVNGHNERDIFQSQANHLGAQSSYSYVTASLEHNQQLPRGLLGRVRVQGQMASERLLSSEQMGIGGPTTVRGYGTSVARGDEGIVASAELYTPVFSPAKRFGWRYSTDELRFLLFADFASVSDVDRYLDGQPNREEESRDLFSLGAGLRYTFNDWLRLRLDAGLPIAYDLPMATAPGFKEEGDRVADIFWHVSATATF